EAYGMVFQSMVLILMAMIMVDNVSSVYHQNQVFVTQAMDVPDNKWRKRAEFDAQITKQILMNDLQTKKMSFLCTEVIVGPTI
ncbi:hypothetical protein Tco_0244050, partial [Tanacetum coccineum]